MLHALQNTTHPSAFRDVKTNVEWSLRCQAHLNFIRWTICNGNRPRVVFARCLGIASIVLGIATAVLLTLSSARRSWRIISAIAFFIGISTLIAAWKGMCVGKCTQRLVESSEKLTHPQCYMACIIATFVPGSSSHPTTSPRGTTRKGIHTTTSRHRNPETVSRTSRGLPSTRSVTLSARSSIARSGSKSRPCVRSRILSSSNPSSERSSLPRLLPASSVSCPRVIFTRALARL